MHVWSLIPDRSVHLSLNEVLSCRLVHGSVWSEVLIQHCSNQWSLQETDENSKLLSSLLNKIKRFNCWLLLWPLKVRKAFADLRLCGNLLKRAALKVWHNLRGFTHTGLHQTALTIPSAVFWSTRWVSDARQEDPTLTAQRSDCHTHPHTRHCQV